MNAIYRIACVVTFLASIQLHLIASDRATLYGTVLDSTGKPLDHATVLVYHAGVKTGYSTYCPSCYRDCGKRTVTDATGKFKIGDLSRDLSFELLAVRDGFVPTFVKKVDPLATPSVTIGLKQRPSDASGSSTVFGRVEDEYGTPMRDAVVAPFAVETDKGTSYGTIPGMDPIAVTNQDGSFELAYQGNAPKIAFTVEARGMAPKFVILPTGTERHKIVLSLGALVRGRITNNGKPVGGIEIGLSPHKRWSGGANLNIQGSVFDEIRIGTRDDGTFAIPNVPTPEDWEIFGTMESIHTVGATDPLAVSTARDKQQIDVGELRIKTGFSIQGKVSLIDGEPLPEGSRIHLSSQDTWDAQSVVVRAHGEYQFTGLPAGVYSLWTSVKGYNLPSGKNDLKASVDHDMTGVDLTLQPSTSTRQQ